MEYLLSAAPLLAALFWGLAFSFIKLGLRCFSPEQLIFLRFAIASAGFALLYALGHLKGPRLRVRDLPRFGFIVATGMLIYQLALVEGEREVSASTASLLGQVSPLLLFIMGRVGARSWPTGRQLLGLALAVPGGVGLVAASPAEDASSARGLALVALTPVAFAAFSFASKPLVQRYGAAHLTALATLAATAVFATQVSAPDLTDALAASSPSSTSAVVGLGLLSTLGGYGLWFLAMTRRGAAGLAPYLYLIPVFGLLSGAMVLDEMPDAAQLLAGVAVIGGARLLQRA